MTLRITLCPYLKEEIFALKKILKSYAKKNLADICLYDITYGVTYGYLLEFQIVIVPNNCENE